VPNFTDLGGRGLRNAQQRNGRFVKRIAPRLHGSLPLIAATPIKYAPHFNRPPPFLRSSRNKVTAANPKKIAALADHELNSNPATRAAA
jgi:hypothetical protein